MHKLKNLHHASLFLLGIFLANFFWAYFQSKQVIIATSSYNFLYSDFLITCLSLLGILSSILFSFSYNFHNARRILSLILYLLILVSINFNLFLLQLHYAYTSVSLIYLAFFYAQNEEDNFITLFKTKFHSKHFITVLFFASFTMSGISKFFFDEWRDGQCLMGVFSRPGLFFAYKIARQIPQEAYALLSWLIGAIELLSLPLYLYRPTRFIAWLLILLLHVAIFITMKDINNISIALIFIQLFLFDKSTFEKSWFFNLKPAESNENI